MKTHKCMTIDTGCLTFECIHHHDDKTNPFWLYYTDGKHRRLVDKFGDRKSVLATVLDYMTFGTL